MDITTAHHMIRWTVHLGPPWRRSDAADYWAWTALNYGAAYTPFAGTTLAADLEPGDLMATLTAGAAFPTTGGLWVGANGTGESWEYATVVDKTGDVLTLLVREPVDAEQTGHHTAGAVATWWWQLSDNDGNLEWTEQIDGPLAAIDWNAKLAGLNFPQAALRNRHLVLIRVSTAEGEGGDWGAYTIAFVGWLVDPKAQDDLRHERAFGGQVVSSAGIVRTAEISGVRIGAHNSAIEGNATASRELACAYKEYESGEFTAGEPDLGPDSAIDGDQGTLYMSERHLGAANEATGWGIDNLHPAVYPGQPDGGKWFQFDLGTLDQYTDTLFWPLNQDGYGPAYLNWGPGGRPITEKPTSGICVICQNKTIFEAENPDTGDALVIQPTACLKIVADGSVHEVVVGDDEYSIADFWAALGTSGALQLGVKQGAVVYDPPPSETIWGTPGTISWLGGVHWRGDYLRALSAGETIRRDWSGNALQATGYSAGWPSMPGYYLDGSSGALFHSTKRRALGLRLKATITDAAPGAGDPLYITSDLGDSVDGLDAAGTIQVAGEQITYSAKATDNKSVTVTARGANGTAAAAHAAGTMVRAVDGGVATDAWPLTKIEIPRPSGLPVLENFMIWGSRLDLVRYPPVPYWTYDYDLLATVTGNNLALWSLALSPAVRYRHILIYATAMSTDPYRLALNEIRLLDDPAVLAASHNLPDGTTVYGAINAILNLAGVEDAAILDLGGTPVVQDVITDTGGAGAVAADYADFGGCTLRCRRDSKFEVGVNPLWAAAPCNPAADHTWTNVNLAAVEPEFRNGGACSQIKLTWRDGTNSASGTVYYPATAAETGVVVPVGPYVCADAAAATVRARNMYYMQRRPRSIAAHANGPAWTALGGQIVAQTWPLASGVLPLSRKYIIQSITNRITELGLESVPVLLQVSREDEK